MDIKFFRVKKSGNYTIFSKSKNQSLELLQIALKILPSPNFPTFLFRIFQSP